jgi:tetratricopeptide (TPR) repeat protein
LSGLGGIGKTQTAIEYAYRYREEYAAVFWARADSRETLVSDYVALARLLGLPGQDAAEQMQVVVAVKRWLEQHAGWLLILDNADELSLLGDFLPTESKGFLLLTTRAQATGKIAESLPVEKLELSEGMQLLLRRAKVLGAEEPLDNLSATVRKAAQQLVQELDGLPLALDQAGAYIEETGCSLAEYLQLYQQRRLSLLKRQSNMASDYPHTVASTWALSFEKVAQANPAAAELLRLCAFLHPDAIPEEIITEGVEELGPVLGQVADDPLLLNDAVQVLRRYSLVKRDPETKQLNMHRLVQVVVKESLDKVAQRLWAERTVRAVNAAFPEVSFETWNRCERCLPHALTCAGLIEQNTFTIPAAARLLEEAGYYLTLRGLYRQAEPLLQQALTIREQRLGTEHPETATNLDHLASLYYLEGKYEKAEPFYQRTLAIREQQLGTEHPETATTLNELAWLYIDQGKYAQAEPLFQRALLIREQKLGSEHPETATTLNDMAVLYKAQSRYAQAEPLYLRALAIREQVLGSTHPDVAESLNNLAVLYKLQGKYAQAESLFLRALAINEEVLGPNHPYTAASFGNLAAVYKDQGKYEQAEPLFQSALTIREQVLESNHPDLALSLHRLGELYLVQGRYEQAEPLYLRALAIREKALGSEHPRTAATLDNLATLYHMQGKYEQAEPLYQRALAIREQKLGPVHPDVAQSLHHLAELYRAQGKYEQAEPLYQRALAIREQALGHEHPDTIKVQAQYNELLRMMQGKKSVTRQREG